MTLILRFKDHVKLFIKKKINFDFRWDIINLEGVIKKRAKYCKIFFLDFLAEMLQKLEDNLTNSNQI